MFVYVPVCLSVCARVCVSVCAQGLSEHSARKCCTPVFCTATNPRNTFIYMSAIMCCMRVCVCLCAYTCVSRRADAGVATDDSAACHSHPEWNEVRSSPEYQSELSRDRTASWGRTASRAVRSQGLANRMELNRDELRRADRSIVDQSGLLPNFYDWIHGRAAYKHRVSIDPCKSPVCFEGSQHDIFLG